VVYPLEEFGASARPSRLARGLLSPTLRAQTTHLTMLPFISTVACSAHPLPTWTSHDLTPWPMPTSFRNGTATLTFAPASLSISAGTPGSPLLERAIARYTDLIRKSSATSPVPASSLVEDSARASALKLTISVQSTSETLDATTNTSYILSIGPDGTAIATSPTIFGALNALASFSQLVETAGKQLAVRGLPWTISDAPRFAHRGVLVDSARHWLPLETLRAHIDAMSFAKLSVLHWHLTDSQSFPFASASRPALVKGAWSPTETYSPADVAGLYAYAKDRGVRLMIEIDTPGHSLSWGLGCPACVAKCPNTIAAHGNGFAALDPTADETYATVEAVLTELGKLAPDSFFHLGGDELRPDCWTESVAVQAMMDQHNWTSIDQVEAYYLSKLMTIAARALPGRTVLAYQEIFDNNITLPPKVAFDVWKRGGSVGDVPSIPLEVAKIVSAGHQAVVANGNHGEWYLNDGWGNGVANSLWDNVYMLDPLNGTDGLLTPQQQKGVIGGEVSLWGEEIDASDLLQRAWPRAAAFAERMWSPRAGRSVSEAAPRLARFACRLKARGIAAQAISPGSCLATSP